MIVSLWEDKIRCLKTNRSGKRWLKTLRNVTRNSRQEFSLPLNGTAKTSSRVRWDCEACGKSEYCVLVLVDIASLRAFSTAKEVEIRDVCDTNHQDFANAIEELIRMKSDMIRVQVQTSHARISNSILIFDARKTF